MLVTCKGCTAQYHGDALRCPQCGLENEENTVARVNAGGVSDAKAETTEEVTDVPEPAQEPAEAAPEAPVEPAVPVTPQEPAQVESTPKIEQKPAVETKTEEKPAQS